MTDLCTWAGRAEGEKVHGETTARKKEKREKKIQKGTNTKEEKGLIRV
jgi:hypothetical protein